MKTPGDIEVFFFAGIGPIVHDPDAGRRVLLWGGSMARRPFCASGGTSSVAGI